MKAFQRFLVPVLVATAAGACVAAAASRSSYLTVLKAVRSDGEADVTDPADGSIPPDVRACIDYIMMYIMESCSGSAAK